MKFGLTDTELESIINTFRKFDEIEEVLLVGSRAMNTYKPTSDIDLAIKGANVKLSTITTLNAQLEELPIPYMFDVVNYHKVDNPEFIKHIDRYGTRLYKKGWKEYKLGELYKVSSGLSKAADQFGFGHTFISFKDVFGNFFLPDRPEGLVNSNEKEQNTCSIKYGDILITRTSETVEEVGMSSVALKDYFNSTFNGFCKRLRPKENAPIEVSPLYMGYLLRTRFFRKTVANYATMTTRASLNGESIKEIPLSFPSIDTQEEIAKTLYSLEKKIALLNKQNQTLEELAQTLFKRWFVEEAGEDWEEKPLSEFIDFREGPGIRNWQYVESDGVNLINIRLINDNDIDITKANKISKEEAFGKYSHFLLKEKDMIVSTSGTLGKSAIVRKHHLPLCLNTSVIRFRPKDEVNYSFVYQYLNSSVFNEQLSSMASGSVQLNFGPTHLKRITVTIPPNDLLKNFRDKADNLYAKIEKNQSQTRTLESLRDTLLPKLMSGEIRIVSNG